MRTLQISVVIIGLALCACSCGNTGTESSSSGSTGGTVDAGSSGNATSSGQSTSSGSGTSMVASTSASSTTGGNSSGTSMNASSTSGGTSNTGSTGGSSSSDNPTMGTLGVYVDVPHPAVLLNGQMYIADMVGNTVQVPAGTYEVEIRPPEMVLDGPNGMNMPRLSQFQKNVVIMPGQMTRFKDAQENAPLRFDYNICGGWVPAGGGTSFVITGQRTQYAPCNDRGYYWIFSGSGLSGGPMLVNFTLNDGTCEDAVVTTGGVSPDGLKIYYAPENAPVSGYMEPATYIKQSHGPCQL